MSRFSPKIRCKLTGNMPERALLRLRRAEIRLYSVKKTQKNTIVFAVTPKDAQKVFAIYPNVCYNIKGYTPYTVQKLPETGAAKLYKTLRRRLALLLGAAVAVAGLYLADGFVLGIEVTGDISYAREARLALAEAGLTAFSRYPYGSENQICAKLMALPDVEFCSLQKYGFWAQVELRLGDFSKPQPQTGAMYAQYTGKLLSVAVLRGTPLKKEGDSVLCGEPLVSDILPKGEGQVCDERVNIIARVRIACTYQAVIEAENPDAAFMSAYLEISRYGEPNITEYSVTLANTPSQKTEDVSKNFAPITQNTPRERVQNGTPKTAYAVQIVFLAVQSMNMT